MKHALAIATAAAAVFAVNPVVDELYVTEDGNAWIPRNKQLAQAHARLMKLPDPVNVKRQDISDQVVKKQARLALARPEARAAAEMAARKKAAADKAAADKAAADKAAADKAAAGNGGKKGK